MPPGREKVRIRFRKDGRAALPGAAAHLPQRADRALKIMCDLDISERRKPQDGKINFAQVRAGPEARTARGHHPHHNNLEDVVMRLLASASRCRWTAGPEPAQPGAQLQDRRRAPYGMVLCVGPTGSGKTTTLHSVLGYINTPERKIWTAEDPVEITQPACARCRSTRSIDWTFAKALRAFLRADPDVIMVGEIRDKETASIAIEAS
jgi:type II secretory ATPase GspE/PulE/Tfp pilus assembly ATPase PilB-like protein